MDPNQQQDQDNQQPPVEQDDKPQAEQQAGWQYNSGKLTNDEPGDSKELADSEEPGQPLAEWEAQEFIEHNKGFAWYLGLVFIGLMVSVALYFITREVLSVAVILVLTLVIGVYGSAKPKVVHYVIDTAGISLDGKHYNFADFKSFSVIESDHVAVPYLQLMPIKKLTVPITIFVDPEHSKQVTELIGQFVPYDQKQPDFADKLAARFRF